jgi:hypothetical protein
MKKQRIKAKIADLILNEGQLDWLPENPRSWTRTDIDRTIESLKRDPDFQEDNPIKVVPFEDKLLVFAGNLRTTGARELKWDSFEAMLYEPETDEDKATIKRRAILDNGSFGSWDYDRLANEWDDLPLEDWGLPAWMNVNKGDFEEIENLNIESVSKAGESKSGFSAITFVFPQEEADIVKGWIENNSKDELTARIVEICQYVEAK